MESGLLRLKYKKINFQYRYIMSREVQVNDNNVSLAAILEKMEAMEKKMNDLIEENKQLKKLNQKLKTTSQRKTKKN